MKLLQKAKIRDQWWEAFVKLLLVMVFLGLGWGFVVDRGWDQFSWLLLVGSVLFLGASMRDLLLALRRRREVFHRCERWQRIGNTEKSALNTTLAAKQKGRYAVAAFMSSCWNALLAALAAVLVLFCAIEAVRRGVDQWQRNGRLSTVALFGVAICVIWLFLFLRHCYKRWRTDRHKIGAGTQKDEGSVDRTRDSRLN